MDMTSEHLLDEMRDALAIAVDLEKAGHHKTAHAYGQLAARKIEAALAQGWGDRDQFKVKGELVRIPDPNVAETQLEGL